MVFRNLYFVKSYVSIPEEIRCDQCPSLYNYFSIGFCCCAEFCFRNQQTCIHSVEIRHLRFCVLNICWSISSIIVQRSSSVICFVDRFCLELIMIVESHKRWNKSHAIFFSCWIINFIQSLIVDICSFARIDHFLTFALLTFTQYKRTFRLYSIKMQQITLFLVDFRLVIVQKFVWFYVRKKHDRDL